MMNQRNLIKLGVVTVVAVAAAVAINHSRQPVSEFSAQANALVGGLGEHVNAVSRITLTTANRQKAVELERGEKGWTIKEKGGYAADIGKLRAYLLKVADASLIEAKTANKDRYPDIGVSDISEATAKGVLVDIEGLAAPVSFIVGNFNAQGGGTYVRRNEETQSWLAKGNLIPEKSPSDWLQKDLVNIPSERIASVSITHPDGKTLRVYKNSPQDAHYTIADLPKGREAVSEFAANGLAAVLADLSIDDVAPAAEIVPPGNTVKIRYQTVDGVVIDASEWQVGEKHYAAFSASLDSAVADTHIATELAKAAVAEKAAEPKPGQGDASKVADAAAAAQDGEPPAKAASPEPVKTREQRLAELNTEIATLNSRFSGWSFVLPAFKSANMSKSMDDLLKPVENKTAGKPAKTGKPGG